MGPFPPRVLVEDIGVDVVLVPCPDGHLLILRPGQSFESAVTQVRAVCPDLHPDTVRALVREHLPGAVDLPDPDDFLPPPPPSQHLAGAPGRRRTTLKVAGAATTGLLIAGAGLTVVIAEQVDPADQVRTAAPSLDVPASASDDAYSGARFASWASTGTMICSATGSLTAQCTDEDGMVMASEAAIGPGWVVYTFSYGRDRILLRIFEDSSKAQRWAEEAAMAEHPHMRVVNRFVLWGTDDDRIDVYADSIIEANTTGIPLRTSVAGASYHLSSRLGHLVAGTAAAPSLSPPSPAAMEVLERVVTGTSASRRPVVASSSVPTAPAPPVRASTGGRHAAPVAPSASATPSAPSTPVLTASAPILDAPAPTATAGPASALEVAAPTATATAPTAAPTVEPTASPTAGEPNEAPTPDAEPTTTPEGLPVVEVVEESERA